MLNLVAVELFVLLVNRMGQAIVLVLVLSKWERRKQQASDDPQDAQRDRQTRSASLSSECLVVFLWCVVIQERMVQVASTGAKAG
jgi:hypothetical protein